MKERKRKRTELLLFLDKSAVEGVGGLVVEKLETVEDLDGAAALDADDATDDATRMRLRLHSSVVIGDVDNDERVELEGKAAARRRRHFLLPLLFFPLI